MSERYDKEIIKSEYERKIPLFTQINYLNVIEYKIETPLSSKAGVFEEKNSVSILWDELESFLEIDEDFKIEKIENKSIIIKTLRKEAFNNVFVMAKIIGRIIPFNCKIKLRVREYRAPDPDNDLLIYNFNIKSDYNNFYEGTIFIKK